MSAALKGSIAAGQGARFSGANVLHRKNFSGQAVSMSMPRKQLSRGGALVVRAFEDEEEEPREWPYAKFVQGDAVFSSGEKDCLAACCLQRDWASKTCAYPTTADECLTFA